MHNFLHYFLQPFAPPFPAAWVLRRGETVLAPEQSAGRCLFLFKSVADAREFIAATGLDEFMPHPMNFEQLIGMADELEGEVPCYVWNPPPFGNKEVFTPYLLELKVAAQKELERRMYG